MKPIDYSKTIMYKIVCNDIAIIDCYVGHTTQFTKRKCCHKTKCNNKNDPMYNIKIYQTIRLHGGWNEWSMVMIEVYPCANKLEACKRERELFEELNTTMNTTRPYKTEKDCKEDVETNALYRMIYRAQHKDELKIQKKEYYDLHKDEIKIKEKIYYQINKEKLLQQQKLYYMEHQDEIKIYKKEYKEKNKDAIKIRRSIQYECICGKSLLWDHKSRHEKTICHQNFIETINKFEPEMTVVEPEMSLTEAENS